MQYLSDCSPFIAPLGKKSTTQFQQGKRASLTNTCFSLSAYTRRWWSTFLHIYCCLLFCQAHQFTNDFSGSRTLQFFFKTFLNKSLNLRLLENFLDDYTSRAISVNVNNLWGTEKIGNMKTYQKIQKFYLRFCNRLCKNLSARTEARRRPGILVNLQVLIWGLWTYFAFGPYRLRWLLMTTAATANRAYRFAWAKFHKSLLKCSIQRKICGFELRFVQLPERSALPFPKDINIEFILEF